MEIITLHANILLKFSSLTLFFFMETIKFNDRMKMRKNRCVKFAVLLAGYNYSFGTLNTMSVFFFYNLDIATENDTNGLRF